MQSRKITVIQTKNQKKSVIMSAATTLAELKSDLRANGIDYNGMTFFEGTSKVELKNDASVLPHDVPYKGIITNELVFMLTNTNKKIRSGAVAMSRAEAYSAIKSMGLQDACVKKFGKNFTMCKTADLIYLVNSKSAAKPATHKPAAPKAEAPKTEPVAAPAVPATPSAPAEPVTFVDTQARAAIRKLVNLLYQQDTIEDYDDVDEILTILDGDNAPVSAQTGDCKPSSGSPYSDNELDDMFKDMPM